MGEVLLLIVFFPISSPAFGSMTLMNDTRQEIIEHQLDRFSHRSVSPHQISWNAVCYQSADRYKERNYLINKTLDQIEDRLRYEKAHADHPATRSKGPVRKKIPYDELVKQNMTVRFDGPEGPTTPMPNGLEQDETLTDDPKSPVAFDCNVMVGQRIDEVRFDIAGNLDGSNPNVASDLTWSDLKMRQIKATANVVIKDRYMIDGMVASADIYEGDNQDSDYLGDNRTFEYSRSNNRSDDGDTLDYAVGLGYRFALPDNQYLNINDVDVSVLAGYSYHEQNLIMTDGLQTKDPYGLMGFTGPFDGLHNNYETEWKGPWWGVALTGRLKKLCGQIRFEYHYADYYAWANWNLRTDFAHPISYEHTAEGHGLVFNLGLDYQLTKNFSLDFNADIQDWNTEPGIIEFHLADGTHTKQMLNRVDWRSYAFMVGTTYHFN